MREEALEIVERYTIGPMFTPPSVRGAGSNDNQGTIQLPGSQGGADIQGAAFDPETNYLYIPSITSPVRRRHPRGESRPHLTWPTSRARASGSAGRAGCRSSSRPTARVTAFDMNTGEEVWMVPNGYGPTDHPAIAHPESRPPRVSWPSGAAADEDAALPRRGVGRRHPAGRPRDGRHAA